jgi:hypothetical protein
MRTAEIAVARANGIARSHALERHPDEVVRCGEALLRGEVSPDGVEDLAYQLKIARLGRPAPPRPPKRVAQHRMTIGRVIPYEPRDPETRARAERVRVFLAELSPHKPTVRSTFYDLVGFQLIPKTEDDYKRWQDQMARMRKGGWIALDSVIDSSRSAVTWSLYASAVDALLDGARRFFSDPWVEQDEWVMVWCEADTHRALLTPIAREFMTPLVPCHGYASLSALHEWAQKINARFEETGQRSHILWAGDHDPSGVDLSRHLHERLVEVHMHRVAAVVERIAITPQQIAARHAMLVPELVAIVRAKIEQGITHRSAWDSRADRDRQMRRFVIDFIEERRDEIDAGPTEDED